MKVSEVPVLIIIWKRPSKTALLIRALRSIKPSQVFVACDGYKHDDPELYDKVVKTRQQISELIDWPCTIYKKFSEVNQGCKVGVISAINWFFENVEAGIILEDDCIPSVEFFLFCSKLIDYYRYDYRIWSISGTNFQKSIKRGSYAYYFSQIPLIWGWATWKTRWEYYDSDIALFNSKNQKDISPNIFDTIDELNYWTNSWSKIKDGIIDTWDYQWVFTCIINNGLTIVPNANLVNNIGFDQEATHTKESSIKMEYGLFEYKEFHPPYIIRDKQADKYQFKNHYLNSNRAYSIKSLKYKLRKFLEDPSYYPKKLTRRLLFR